MNFVSDALMHLEQFAQISKRQGKTIDASALRFVMSSMRRGVKYLLPQHGKVGVRSLTSEMFQYVRSPYPIAVFEFATLDKVVAAAAKSTDYFFGKPATGITASSKRIVLVIDGESDEFKALYRHAFDGVVIIPVSYMDGNDLWIASPIAVMVPRVNTVRQVNVEGKIRITFDSHVFELLPGLVRDAIKDAGPQVRNDFIRDTQEDVTVIIGALIATNCRNIGSVTIPPSAKLNKKREKSGKEPFYEYRVLDIFLPERALPSGGGRRRRAVEEALHRPTFKLHSVSGHFKHRKTGMFWWRDHIRGSAAVGVVEKDYNIRSR